MSYGKKTTLTAAGSPGSATATHDINVNGKIYAIKLDYTGLPATTDVTLSEGTTEVLSRANSNTDETFYPRLPATKADGSASTLTEVAPILAKLHVDVAGGDPDGTLVVTVFSE